MAIIGPTFGEDGKFETWGFLPTRVCKTCHKEKELNRTNFYQLNSTRSQHLAPTYRRECIKCVRVDMALRRLSR